ncbi:MAG: mechanosensitive ion channel family protein [Gammaproteobacteria bacterium]|nr:mechanosensitive ion channel family protein [Gammaproteobacteria bacterium]
MEQDIQQIQNIVDILSEFAVNYGFQVFGAIVILFIGWQVSRWVARAVLNICERAGLDITLAKFFAGIAKTLIIVFVAIVALGKFGITITPLIAALGAIAFGSTLALQGPLSNYGSGLTIILTRPFILGDTIRIQNVIGIVEEIKLAYTWLITEDGERITIPNNRIIGEILHNTHENLIVEASISISYESNTEEAVALILKVLGEFSDVTRDPEPQVGIERFADSAIVVGVRYWVPTKQYYQIMYRVNQKIYSALKDANIIIPFPRQDIHIFDDKN